MKLFSKACIVLALFVLVGCGGGGNGSEGGGDDKASSDADVETVMHNGKITKVNSDAKKIMVDVNGETKEFSIVDSTQILNRQYQEMAFDSLKVDGEVGVEVEKGGSKPMQVNILN